MQIQNTITTVIATTEAIDSETRSELFLCGIGGRVVAIVLSLGACDECAGVETSVDRKMKLT